MCSVLIKMLQSLVKAAQFYHTGQDVNLGSIYQNLGGVLFLGTPQRRSPLTKWAEILRRVAKLALRPTNDQILKTLCPDSETLEQQRSSFIGITEKIMIACFYEELPTGAGMVLKTFIIIVLEITDKKQGR